MNAYDLRLGRCHPRATLLLFGAPPFSGFSTTTTRQPPASAMDAMYRAAMDAPSRVVLSESARRRKDRASAARARSKGYSASGGLTSTLLDRWWHEATGAPARRLPGRPHEAPPTAMRGDQAVAFFNRTGLPTGASLARLPADRTTRSRATPRPLVFPPPTRRGPRHRVGTRQARSPRRAHRSAQTGVRGGVLPRVPRALREPRRPRPARPRRARRVRARARRPATT